MSEIESEAHGPGNPSDPAAKPHQRSILFAKRERRTNTLVFGTDPFALPAPAADPTVQPGADAATAKRAMLFVSGARNTNPNVFGTADSLPRVPYVHRDLRETLVKGALFPGELEKIREDRMAAERNQSEELPPPGFSEDMLSAHCGWVEPIQSDGDEVAHAQRVETSLQIAAFCAQTGTQDFAGHLIIASGAMEIRAISRSLDVRQIWATPGVQSTMIEKLHAGERIVADISVVQGNFFEQCRCRISATVSAQSNAQLGAYIERNTPDWFSLADPFEQHEPAARPAMTS